MNYTLRVFLVIFVLWAQSAIGAICVNTVSNLAMWSVLTSDATVRGSELAFQDSKFQDYHFFSSDNNMDLVTQLEKMSAAPCQIILGLVTSRDCLIAGPILKKNTIIGMSPICGHDDVNKFIPYLYTATPPISAEGKAIAGYLQTHYPLHKLYVIYQPANIFSDAEFREFKANYFGAMTVVPVDIDTNFDIHKFKAENHQDCVIVFFTYPLPSLKILTELAKNSLINKKVTILGASSWSFDISVLQPLKSIFINANNAFMVDVISWNKVKRSNFTKKFLVKFNREPLVAEVMSYDVARFAVSCYSKSFAHGKYDIKLFQRCLVSHQHDGISGSFSFTNDTAFSTRPIYIYRILDRI